MIDFSKKEPLDKDDIKKFNLVEKSLLKQIKEEKEIKKGGTISKEKLSLKFTEPDKQDKKKANEYINDANNSLIEFTDGYPNFKAPIQNDGLFKIQSVLKDKNSKKSKLIIGIYDKNRKDLIHISIFIYSFIHITFNFNDINNQIYYLENPDSNKGWETLLYMVKDIEEFILEENNNTYFKNDDKWKNIIPKGKGEIKNRLEILVNCLIDLCRYIPFIKTSSSISSPVPNTSPLSTSSASPPSSSRVSPKSSSARVSPPKSSSARVSSPKSSRARVSSPKSSSARVSTKSSSASKRSPLSNITNITSRR